MKRNVALGLALLVARAAAADPTVTVEPAVPFTQAELDSAVTLRGGSKARVRVGRRGGALVIDVDGRIQVIELEDSDPHASARVVAMVIIALGRDAPPASVIERDNDDPVLPREPVPKRSKLAMRAMIGKMRDDGGAYSTPLSAALAYELAPLARITASATVGKIAAIGHHATVVPLRLGLEGRAGAAAIELGLQAAPDRECTGALGATVGAYGIARVFLPLGGSPGRLVLEGGGYYVANQYAGCEEGVPVRYGAHGGFIAGGVEWPL
jgi:hypothetical protein